jgi:hypothetical protein
MQAAPGPYRLNEKAAILVNHTIVAIMMACIAYTIVRLAQRLSPGWQGNYLPLLMFLISIETMVTRRTMRRWADLRIYGMAYWLVEWVVLAVLIKFYLYIATGNGFILVNIPLLLRDFLTNFFTYETLFVLLVAFVIWLISSLYTQDLIELEGGETLIKLSDADRVPIDRSQIRRGLVARVFTHGCVLIFVTALLHVDFRTLRGDPMIARGDLLNVIIYFLLGLVLFSQTHLTLLRTNWAWDRLPISTGITKSWTFLSVIFLGIVSAIAFLLPTRYTLGLLSTLSAIVSILIAIFYFVFFIISLPLMALYKLVLSLFSKNPLASGPIQPPPFLQFNPEMPPIARIPWLELLKSLLFWLGAMGIIGYAFYQYFRQNQEQLERLNKLPIFSWLARALKNLWAQLRGASQVVVAAIQSGLKRLHAGATYPQTGSRAGYLNLRRMSPRQQIQFFYLALVRRGGERGINRRASQTPYEYTERLSTEVSEVSSDLEAMTDAFVEARYSRHEITAQRANRVRGYWDRVKKALRGRGG